MSSLAGHSALIVEDDDDLATYIAVSLSKLGLRVRVERSGEEALITALADPADINFVDIGLPGMDGWELIDLLRGDERMRGAKIVAVTILDHCAGHEPVDAWLSKPFGRRQLGDIARRLLDGDKKAAAIDLDRNRY